MDTSNSLEALETLDQSQVEYSNSKANIILSRAALIWRDGFRAGVELLRVEMLHHQGDIKIALQCLSGQSDESFGRPDSTCKGCIHCVEEGKVRRRNPYHRKAGV